MPITINGNGTVTGLAVGGLPDGTVDRDTLATAAKGSILQVQTAVLDDTQLNINSTSWTDTGLSVNITPLVTTSKCIVQFSGMGRPSSTAGFTLEIREEDTAIGQQGMNAHGDGTWCGVSFQTSPFTPSWTAGTERTFDLYWRSINTNATVYLGWGSGEGGGRLSLTAWEIAQ